MSVARRPSDGIIRKIATTDSGKLAVPSDELMKAAAAAGEVREEMRKVAALLDHSDPLIRFAAHDRIKALRVQLDAHQEVIRRDINASVAKGAAPAATSELSTDVAKKVAAALRKMMGGRLTPEASAVVKDLDRKMRRPR